MSKRQSAESKIITWFESAPMASVAIVLGIVKEKVRMRQLADVGVVTVPRRTRAKKTKRTNAASPATAFPGVDTGATA